MSTRTEHRRSWLDDDANLRAWHEAGWWARFVFRAMQWWARRSDAASLLMIRAGAWHAPHVGVGPTSAPTKRPTDPSNTGGGRCT